MHDDKLGTFLQIYFRNGTRNDIPLGDDSKNVIHYFTEGEDTAYKVADVVGRDLHLRIRSIDSLEMSTPESRELWRERNFLYDQANEKTDERMKEKEGTPDWL